MSVCPEGGATEQSLRARFVPLTLCVQVSELSHSRERARKEVKEKEEEKQQMKEGLRAALEEMTTLKLLLQVLFSSSTNILVVIL